LLRKSYAAVDEGRLKKVKERRAWGTGITNRGRSLEPAPNLLPGLINGEFLNKKRGGASNSIGGGS